MAFFKSGKNKTLELGKQSPMTDALNQVFKIKSFDDNGTIMTSESSVKARSRFKPYGYLDVVNPQFTQPHKLRIIHRDDFILAANIFHDPYLVESINDNEVEFLVCYSPLMPNKQGYSTSPQHVLHYAIAANGTLDEYYADPSRRTNPKPELIFGELNFAGELSVKDLINV